MPIFSPQGRALHARLLAVRPDLKHRAEWIAQDAESIAWHLSKRPPNNAKISAIMANLQRTTDRCDLTVEYSRDTRGLVVKLYSAGRQWLGGL